MAVPMVINAGQRGHHAPIDERSPSGKTARTSEHRCISIRARVDSRVTGYASHEFQCSGADAADQFVAKLNSLRPELVGETTRNIPMGGGLAGASDLQPPSATTNDPIYLEVRDVLLLADVFESFRDTCMRQYNLDPCNYVTLPGMCWDGAMRTAKGAPELITDDISKYLHFERAIRGGVSMVTRRHAKANNPMCPDYDRTKPTSFITYLDANNLYGWAMMQYLPCSGFTWAPQMTLEEVLAGDWDCARGCSVEVDLEYPTDLHDAHSDLPLAPEKLKLGW
eukprot:jgi/Tetstr1/443548/TSEL_003250.t1